MRRHDDWPRVAVAAALALPFAAIGVTLPPPWIAGADVSRGLWLAAAVIVASLGWQPDRHRRIAAVVLLGAACGLRVISLVTQPRAGYVTGTIVTGCCLYWLVTFLSVRELARPPLRGRQ